MLRNQDNHGHQPDQANVRSEQMNLKMYLLSITYNLQVGMSVCALLGFDYFYVASQAFSAHYQQNLRNDIKSTVWLSRMNIMNLILKQLM